MASSPSVLTDERDALERAEFAREVEAFERSRRIAPSRLVVREGAPVEVAPDEAPAVASSSETESS